MPTIDGHEYVSVRADALIPGDTIHFGARCVAWAVEPSGSSRTKVYLGTTAAADEWQSLGVTFQWNSNPVWLSAYDAAVTGRDTETGAETNAELTRIDVEIARLRTLRKFIDTGDSPEGARS